MIENKQKLELLAKQARESGEGALVAIYNDIEQKWYYYIGEFKPKNPSNHIYYNSIRGKSISHMIENPFTYFSGDLAKNELINTEFSKLKKENIEFDFRFIWFK